MTLTARQIAWILRGDLPPCPVCEQPPSFRSPEDDALGRASVWCGNLRCNYDTHWNVEAETLEAAKLEWINHHG